ncbi:MAG TPA: NUDIX hydrolase [Rhizomicrobium sp.]|jgi:8-oxo-dGTP pyrophosphatase MutT (NUDIX family)|nr:NUDIX hydrolase [Rhizomicrobium sp.]
MRASPISAAPAAHQIQYGVLPWRMMGGILQILLITTRNTRRWIVPKGWPMDGLSPRECVAQEAMEEAGVQGAVSRKPLGWFSYDKLRKSGEILPCKVQVFAMEVKRQHADWPEKAARHLRWVTPPEALTHVGEPGLRQIISDFAHAAESRKRRTG